MKKIIQRFISVAMTAALICSFWGIGAVTALADGAYTLTDGDVTVTADGTITAYNYVGGGDIPTDIIIPNMLDGKKIIAIGPQAFQAKGLTSVVLPDTVEYLDNYSFVVNGLTSVVMPDSVTGMGEYVFAFNSISSITFSKNLKKIGDYAFWNNTPLTKLAIPEGITEIGREAFKQNMFLTSVTFPSTLTTIGDSAFNSCGLTSVKIPDSVTTIGSSVFMRNNITSVTLSKNITNLPYGVFRDNKLKSINFPNGLTRISQDSFANNELTSVVIPDGVTYIGSSAFSHNELITAVIPDSVTSMNQRAFEYNQLTEVNIPSGLTEITGYVFEHNNLKHITIPDGMTAIGNCAFSDNNLSKVTIPASVNELSMFAFSGNRLCEFTLESDVTAMPDANCFNAQNVGGSLVSQWYKDKQYSGSAVDIYAPRTGSTTYYAYFFGDVTFVENGGSEVGGDITDQLGFTKITKPADPTKEKHTFGGWYMDNETFENEWDFDIDELCDNITLYAKWNPVRVDSVTLNKTEATVTIGDTLALTATVLPTNAVHPEVTWTSSDESIATVDEYGKVITVGVGNTTITATADEKSAECALTVNPVHVTSITLDKSKVDMLVSGELTLTATVLPDDATYPEVTWTSSNENAATIDQSGKVTAVGVGKAVVTATVDGKTAQCAISVTSGKMEKPEVQRGNIRGRIVDSKGNALAGFTVVLHSDPITAVTDANGAFVFPDVPLTNHTLLIEASDGSEIGRYGLSFTQGSQSSIVKGEKEVDITCTSNTVAIDVLINVSADGKSTTLEGADIVNNPKTGKNSILWLVLLGIVLICGASFYGAAHLKRKYQ